MTLVPQVPIPRGLKTHIRFREVESRVPCWLGPLFAKLFQDTLLELRRRHHYMEFYVRVEGEKPGFSQCGHLGRVNHINNQDRPPLPLLFGKINGLGISVFQNASHFIADAPVPDCLVEPLMGDFTLRSIRMANLQVLRNMTSTYT
jgi:hypothetical protein